MVDREGEFAISIDWLYSTKPEPAIATHIASSTFIELGRSGADSHVTPIRVDLMRPNPHVGLHEGYFGCPIRYGSVQN